MLHSLMEQIERHLWNVGWLALYLAVSIAIGCSAFKVVGWFEPDPCAGRPPGAMLVWEDGRAIVCHQRPSDVRLDNR